MPPPILISPGQAVMLIDHLMQSRAGRYALGAVASVAPLLLTPAAWIATFMAACVLLVAPLAHATPPDPGWIAGYWDDADADHAISLVASCVGTMDVPRVDNRPSAIVVGLASDRDPGPQLLPRPSATSTRAPPDA